LSFSLSHQGKDILSESVPLRIEAKRKSRFICSYLQDARDLTQPQKQNIACITAFSGIFELGPLVNAMRGQKLCFAQTPVLALSWMGLNHAPSGDVIADSSFFFFLLSNSL